MKKYTLFIVMALLVSICAKGQEYAHVTQAIYAHESDFVRVDMKIELADVKVSGKTFVLFTPTIKSEIGTMDLPSVMICGKTSFKAYNRAVSLGKGPEYVKTALDSRGKKSPSTYDYSVTVPYELWMSKAELVINEYKNSCSDCSTLISSTTIAETIENRNPPVPPTMKSVDMDYVASFKVPLPEAVKSRSESGKAYLDYATGKSNINVNYKDNAYELDKIGRMILSVKKNPYATITGVTIEGYSSPEGSYATNLTLSSRRAASLKDHIRTKYGIRESLFSVTGQGEDLATLDSLVAVSTMRDKEEVLNIIRSSDQPDVKEKNLRAISSGAVFKQLTEELFPKLRRSDYELKYTIIPFTVEKGKEVIKVAPENLSLNEMFLIAETYNPNSKQYSEVFEIAAKVYPNNDISNVNAAANALANHDIKAARLYLAKVKEHDAVWYNNMGVMYAMDGNFVAAREHLIEAERLGNEEAKLNLIEIDNNVKRK